MEYDNIPLGLGVMIKEVREVAEGDVSDECRENAESALESLMKSAAIHGFNIVTEDSNGNV